jgi:hypothetical protein
VNYFVSLCCSTVTAFLRLPNQLTNSVVPETESSSPHSQEPATSPYPEPDESTPYTHTHTHTHTPTNQPTNLPKICSNPILPSMPRSSKWCLSFRLSHQNPVHFSPLSYAGQVPCPPHYPCFDLPNDIWWWVKFMKLNYEAMPIMCWIKETERLSKRNGLVLKKTFTYPLNRE